MTTKTVFPPTRSPRALAQKVPGWAWALLGSGLIYVIVSRLILAEYSDSDVTFRLSAAPFLTATLAVQIHVTAALSTFFIGLAILMAPKGLGFHRTLGWTWVIAMTITAVSSFFITGIFQNSYSPIHALSAWTLLGLPFGVAAARRRDIKKHRQQMTGMFLGGMLIAGLFTFLPWRLMWQMFFSI